MTELAASLPVAPDSYPVADLVVLRATEEWTRQWISARGELGREKGKIATGCCYFAYLSVYFAGKPIFPCTLCCDAKKLFLKP